jgi:hypothetical protein
LWYALLTLSTSGTTGLDLPDVVLSYPVEIEGLGYIVGSHGYKFSQSASAALIPAKNGMKLTAINILLVGEDEEDDVAHFAVLDNTAEFGFGFFHASSVAGVDYKDESVGACGVGGVSLWFGIPDFGWLASKSGLTSSCDLNPYCQKDGIVYPTYQRSSVSKAA